jgi:arylsulfatase A
MARFFAITLFCLTVGFVAWALLKQRLGRPRQAESPQARQRSIANPPNFVIVVGGSIGCGDLGCYGQKHIATPHLDRLAKEGVRLSEFYAGDPTGEATCWCLLTGRDMAAAKSSAPNRFALRPQQATVAEVLRRAGYDTGFVGDWSLGGDDSTNTPGQHGFTEWVTIPRTEGATSTHPDAFWRTGQRVRVTSNMDGKQGQYVTDLVMQEATSFLQQHKTGNPFLLFVVCPRSQSSDGIPSLHAYADTDWPQSRKSHSARVTEFDRLVGLVMDELAELKLAHRTALLVTSDCGPAEEPEREQEFFKGTRGLRGGQGTLYEGGLRVPFLARWPGQAFSGVERDYAAVCWDLLPTLAELSGAVNVPKQLDGVSIASILRGGIGRSRDMLYWEIRQDDGLGQAVRMGDWKVIRPAGKTRREDCELYNLKKDPIEKKNVAAQHPEIVAKFLK